MPNGDTFITLALALGLGMLVGLQRERVESEVAGIRTFPLITLLGAISALLAGHFGGWILAASLLGVVAAMVLGNIYAVRKSHESPGTTTEFAMLVMFAIGALVVVGPRAAAIVTTGAVVLLLHAKDLLHSLVRKMGERDVRAIMLFVLIALVVLPILPDANYGPRGYPVWNPRQIWLVVVLVVGISFGGYIAYRLVGRDRGAVLGGLLGGIISSTAATVSYSRRAAGDRAAVPPAVLVIVIASGVVYGRVLAEIAVVAPGFFPTALAPIGVMLAVSALAAFVVWLQVRREPGELPEQKNPTELKTALVFAAMYALVILAVAWAEREFGRGGIYAAAGLSGLTSMDAITLSTSRLVAQGGLDPATAWRAIVVAAISNVAFKLGLAAFLGGPRLFLRSLAPMSVQIAAGVALLLFWPEE